MRENDLNTFSWSCSCGERIWHFSFCYWKVLGGVQLIGETNFCVLLKYTQAASGLFLSSLLFLLDVSPCEPAHPETVLLNIFHFSPLPPVTFLCLSTHGSLSSLWSLVSYWPVLSWGGRVSVLADCALRHPVCGAADFSFLPEEENVND